MSLRGLPDWQRPLDAGGVFAAYEQPGVWFTAPTTLEPAAVEGLVVDRFAEDRGAEGGIIRHGLVTLRWESGSDRAGDTIPGAARPLPIQTGLVRLTGPALLRDPDGAAALGEAFPLDQAGLATFVAAVRLDDASTELLLEAHARGTALIGVDVVLRARGVAARTDSVAEVLLPLLRDAWSGEVDGDLDRLRARLRDDPGALGIRLVAGAPTDDAGRADMADALADRVLALLTVPAAPPTRDPGALILGGRIPVRVELTAPAEGTLRWDLATPLLAPRLFGLGSSPLVAGGPPADVRDHTPPTLSSGRHRITVSTTATPPWAGGAPGFEIEIPPNPPFRPQRIRVGQLFDLAPRVTEELLLTPVEPLSGSLTGTVVFDSGEQASGAPVPLDRPEVLLRTDAFPARFLPLELSGSLDGCEVAVDWFDNPEAAGPPRATAVLRAEADRVTLVTPVVADATMRIRATSEGRVAATPAMPAGPLLVDAFSFPGTGSRSVALEAWFGPMAPGTLSVELVAEGREEDPAAPVQRHLARGQPRSEWTRFVASPFATGFRWREVGEATWSEVERDSATLRMTVTGDEITVEGDVAGTGIVRAAGLLLLPIGTDGRRWAFAPEAPSVATQPDGRASFSLLDVAGQHLLTLTAWLNVDEDRQRQAREVLAASRQLTPAEVELSPAALAGPTAVLSVMIEGAVTELATSTTSRTWPYNAALHAQLTPAQADAVKRALGGERGLLTLHYGGELRTGEAEPIRSTTTTSTTTTSTTTTTLTRSASGGTVTGTTSSEHSETHADSPPAPTVTDLSIDLDGADWLQHH